MAAKQATQSAPRRREEYVNSVLDEEASVTPKRYFTIPGRDPFDEIEWETRDALIPGKSGPAFEQREVEFPKFWSQTATNIVAQKYFRGRMASPERERSVKQMVGRVADTITGWGKQGGYFARDEEADTFHAELKAILVNQYASFNSPVWFNVGFEETPQCSACFILSIDDSMESILDWIRREGIIFRGGSGSGLNLSRLRSSKEQLSKGGYASGPVSFMRGADASAGRSSRAARHVGPRRWSCSTSTIPDIDEFIWCKAREERKARVLEQAGLRHDARLGRLGVDPVPEREQLGARHGCVHGGGHRGQGVGAHGADRRHGRRDGRGAGAAPRHGRRRLGVRRPRRPVRHDDQRMAHVAEHRPDQRVEPLQRVHAHRRLGVQPRLAEPHEVPPRGRRVRRRDVRARRRRRLPRPGDPRRLLVLPDARDRPEREAVPPARPRLREPRCAPDGARPARTTRTRAARIPQPSPR